MKKQTPKAKHSFSADGLDKRMAHLDLSMAKLTKTVEDLALATAKGFESNASKDYLDKKLKNYPTTDDMEMMMGRHIGSFRKDYDSLTSRVKRLEEVVFKR